MRTVLSTITAILLVFSTAYAVEEGYDGFNDGDRISFSADDNDNIAAKINPAALGRFKKSFFGLDIGGDLSFGNIDFSRNEGEPDDPHNDDVIEPESSAAEMSYIFGAHAKGWGVFRFGAFNVSGIGGYERNQVNLDFKGGTVALDPWYYMDGDSNRIQLEFSSPLWNFGGGTAYSFGNSSVGIGYVYQTDYDHGEARFESYSEDIYGGNDTVDVTEAGGRRTYKGHSISSGFEYHPGRFIIGGSFNYDMMENNLEWYDETLTKEPPYSRNYISQGNFLVTGNKIGGIAYAQLPLNDLINIGGRVEVSDIPKYEVERTLTTSSLEDEEETSFVIYEGKEFHLDGGGGIAIYPGDKTALALDYFYRYDKLQNKEYDDEGNYDNLAIITLKHTYSVMGVEHWITDNVATRIGWRQDIFTNPRNRVFAGITCNINENFTVNYDYAGEKMTINNLSVFMALNDIVKPAGHFITVTYNF